jgi:hypothetical protein
MERRASAAVTAASLTDDGIRPHDFRMDLDRDNPLAIEILQEIGEKYFAACRKWSIPWRH